MIPKDIEYRNRKLLDLAHDVNECQLQIPGVCEGYSAHGCEPAHANNWLPVFGKGAARKAHDCFAVPSCHRCHGELDQGKRLTAEEKQFYWTVGFFRTVLLYFRNGWIRNK